MTSNPELALRTLRTMAYVSARIRALRKERRLTVAELADLCGMERSNLSRLEAGRSNMTLRTLCTISEMLGVGVRELFPVYGDDAAAASTPPQPPARAE